MLTFQNRRFGSIFMMCPQELPAVRLKIRLFLQKPGSARLHSQKTACSPAGGRDQALVQEAPALVVSMATPVFLNKRLPASSCHMSHTPKGFVCFPWIKQTDF